MSALVHARRRVTQGCAYSRRTSRIVLVLGVAVGVVAAENSVAPASAQRHDLFEHLLALDPKMAMSAGLARTLAVEHRP